MGARTTASGGASTAMGSHINVSGNYSVGIGLDDIYPSTWNVTADNVMSIMGGKVGIGTTSPTDELHVVGDINCTGKLETATVNTFLSLTQQSGAQVPDANNDITVTTSYVRLGTTTSSLSLDTINGGTTVGQILVLRGPVDHHVQVQDKDSGGATSPNIQIDDLNFSMNNADTLMLIWDGSYWVELSRMDD
jgi:hypothetical protein